LFSSMICPDPVLPLFPYTTLFRSKLRDEGRSGAGGPNVELLDGRRAERIAGSKHDAAAVGGEASRKLPDRGGLARSIDADDEDRSEEHTSELQSLRHLVCRLLLEK